MIRKGFVVFFLSLVFPLFGQFSGVPYIENFAKENFQSKVWDIAQGINGELYLATPKGLTVFDGIRWKNHSAGFESDLRSVYIDDAERIYTSGHGGFGYWSKNDKGILEYTRLFFKPVTERSPLMPVFSKIIELDGNILFQSFQKIHVYDPLTEVFTIIGASKEFEILFVSKERAFVVDNGKGLFELKENLLHPIAGTTQFQKDIVGVFLEENEELLIVTKKRGVWSYNDGKTVKKKWNSNNSFEASLINDAVKTKKDNYVFASQRNGVYLVSKQGEILLHLDKNSGLQNNSILSAFSDNNQNIWLGFENSLSYLNANSNSRLLNDTKSEFGNVYTSLQKDSIFYLGTNQGVFRKKRNDRLKSPERIPGDEKQIWSIEDIDGSILVAHDTGVSKVVGNRLETVNTENGAWIFKKHPQKEDLLYVGYYSGICLFKRIENEWVFQHKIEGFGESSRFIEFDQFGQLWVAHPQKGYYRLVLTPNGEQAKEISFYGEQNQNVMPYAYFCKIDNNLVFFNPLGFFEYDPIENNFIPVKYASQMFKGLKKTINIKQYGNIFWFSTETSLGYVYRNGNKFKRVEEVFAPIRKKYYLNDFNKFTKLNDSLYAVGMNEGLLFHKIVEKPEDKKKIDPPLLQSLHLIGAQDTITASIGQKATLNVPYKNNFLKFTLATPKAPVGTPWEIQYKLEGLDNRWAPWKALTELNFPGLASKKYTLLLRAKDRDDNISLTTSTSFYVASPWYLNEVAILAYVLIFIVFNGCFRAYFKRKNVKHIALLKEQERAKRVRERETYALEKLKTEKQMLVLKEKNLSLEIENKNAELASLTLKRLQRNELISALKKNVKELKNSTQDVELNSQIKKLLKKTDNLLVDKEDWLSFELHFRNAHENFFKNIREKHKDLSSNEYKLSAYLKINLSSKEIASLMHISTRSVEQNRYRLRQKLNLDKEENLVRYIQSF